MVGWVWQSLDGHFGPSNLLLLSKCTPWTFERMHGSQSRSIKVCWCIRNYGCWLHKEYHTLLAHGGKVTQFGSISRFVTCITQGLAYAPSYSSIPWVPIRFYLPQNYIRCCLLMVLMWLMKLRWIWSCIKDSCWRPKLFLVFPRIINNKRDDLQHVKLPLWIKPRNQAGRVTWQLLILAWRGA